jgi:hypothetical protein
LSIPLSSNLKAQRAKKSDDLCCAYALIQNGSRRSGDRHRAIRLCVQSTGQPGR